MYDSQGTDRAAVDLAEALIVALEEACSGASHRRVLPYLGMARAELAQCRSGGPGGAVRVQEVSVDSVPDGLEDLESLLARIMYSNTELSMALRLVSARQLVREGLNEAV